MAADCCRRSQAPHRVPGRLSAYLLLACLSFGAAAWPQPANRVAAAQPSAPVRGIYNWVHTTADAERTFAFYHDVFGIELAPSPFYGDPDAQPPPTIRAVSDAGSDPLVWRLTNTEGARFRTAFMRAGTTPFGIELSEFFDIPRNTRPPNAWDPGASILIFEVRDLDSVIAALAARGAPVVSIGRGPAATAAGPSILTRNPDGYLVQAVQAPAPRLESAPAGVQVLGTSMAITVADTAAALGFYRDLLGFEIAGTRRAPDIELALYGLDGATLQRTRMTIPGTDVAVTLLEFSLPPNSPTPPFPYRWKIQDVGAPQFQLEVTGLGSLIERTIAAGYRFLSIGARPIDRPFGRFVFAIDADGVLVEFVEPAATPSR